MLKNDCVRGKTRDYGIELFRVLLMFLIVFRHCCNEGPLMGSSWLLTFLYVVTCPAVDGFVVISGWYGIRFAWRKFLKLWGMVMFYSLLLFVAQKVTPVTGGGNSGDFVVGPWWFATSYLALMLFAPLVNAAFESLAQTPRRLVVTWGLYALAVTLDWVSIYLPLGMTATGWGSHTFNTLLFVYVTARTLRLLNLETVLRRWGGWALVLLLLILMATIPARVFVCHVLHRGDGGILPGALTYYNVPFVWLAALAGLGLFLVLRPWQWVGRVAVFLGPSMFGIYLIHYNSVGLEWLIRHPESWLSCKFPWMSDSVIVVFCAVFCFMVALCVDLLRRAGVLLFRTLVKYDG